ncbi:hypothetical protein QTI66_38785 [Variovorax sp. J22R133]|uniref:hypothetical protein n=1 Tax=Variovorax brevis TaxID=3053503 RepID=UPI00257905AF|nr:hypothetical protein [Variovorax sp. J22R133]MDM0118029.1 hypothetical protein [Variovorax sp. J22R133]
MANEKEKKLGSRRIVFKKPDFEKFARKLAKWGDSLSPKERALLITVLDKGSHGVRAAGDDVVQTTTTIEVEAADFNLEQFLVELLLALEGVSAEVDEDGPSWVQEITATTKT